MEREEVESGGAIEEFQRRKVLSLSSMIAKVIDYAVDQITAYFSQFGLSRDEAIRFLEENAEILTFDLVDSAITRLDNKLIVAMLNAAIRAGGVFLRSHDGWRIEFKEKGKDYILHCLQVFRPDLYNLLKDKERILNFIKRYIEYKLGF